jgi:hypothetical protein
MTAATTNHATLTGTDSGAQSLTCRQSRDQTQCPTGRDEFTAWLTASCQRQALPVTITDPATLATVAALLRKR